MNKENDQLVAECVAQGGRPQDWRPAYSIAPTVTAPIVREWQDEGAVEREVTLARWDWPKPPNRPSGAPIINAHASRSSPPDSGWARSPTPAASSR